MSTRVEEKEKVPAHIQKFLDLYERVENALQTTEHHHRRAYLAGEETIKDERGVVKHDFLKDREYRQKFVDAMTNSYTEAAKNYFHIGDEEGDELWREQLMHAYAGTTKAELLRLADEYQDRFTYELFSKHQKKLMDVLNQKLSPIPASHLKKEHIDDILEHVNAKGIVDPSKIKVEHAAALLGVYAREHALPKETLRQILPDYALIDEAYK